jgi:hypothetical protein
MKMTTIQIGNFVLTFPEPPIAPDDWQGTLASEVIHMGPAKVVKGRTRDEMIAEARRMIAEIERTTL